MADGNLWSDSHRKDSQSFLERDRCCWLDAASEPSFLASAIFRGNLHVNSALKASVKKCRGRSLWWGREATQRRQNIFAPLFLIVVFPLRSFSSNTPRAINSISKRRVFMVSTGKLLLPHSICVSEEGFKALPVVPLNFIAFHTKLSLSNPPKSRMVTNQSAEICH